MLWTYWGLRLELNKTYLSTPFSDLDYDIERAKIYLTELTLNVQPVLGRTQENSEFQAQL